MWQHARAMALPAPTTRVPLSSAHLAPVFASYHWRTAIFRRSLQQQHYHHCCSFVSWPLRSVSRLSSSSSSSSSSSAGRGLSPVASFFKLGPSPKLPEVVEVGDPVLNEVAAPVPVQDIASQRIQKIIDDMVAVMRAAPGVGIAAPQLGIPLQIIVLEDTKEYINYAPKEETNAQQRSPFDLLVICNPRLKKKGNASTRFFEGCLRFCTRFFEGCLSVQGFRALVERHLEVEVSGFGRDGLPIKVDACGWKARILQHECDHLKGVLYVDRMIPKTFRTINNLRLPLPAGCPKPGVCHNMEDPLMKGIKQL